MNKKSFAIKTSKGQKNVGFGFPCFIIAEMSANHEQDYDQAVAIIKAAAAAGADAVKLQTYTADTLTIDSDQEWFQVDGKDNPESWKNQSFYELYQKAYTPWEWHADLQKLAHELGLIFFSTPFDNSAVDFLEQLQVPCYKIASYEATDIPLLKKVAATCKPVILSVGFASLEEIELALKTLKDNGAKDVALLHCTASYSLEPKVENTHLATMLDLADRFNVVVGFSDNMGGIEVPALAAAKGASIIEKHLVINHDGKALDNTFSLDQKEFAKMVEKIREQEKVMGNISYGPRTKQEEGNKRFRRSLFAVQDIKKGEPFTPNNVRVIRPANGLPPKDYEKVLTKMAKSDIRRGTPLSWDLIK
ncbi:MAG: pseudaminic acid synthase [Candidatus Buchananbacteria bacterium CG10_big_fil_rev_8_21_14_0_10_42_9]|uniref:Pseudaminic acid synthase n=1 Tax=Candidatus Buchananbacteria bacterium CG10_big_fil_rev_8_21_14_0_10_42_9 TaxID=1974526 RepID=A0A2H0W1P2_9BACT|nr:MAG: pseudaminic acid synthase [Candidatus Buchananbacteria bacterium CG10_big_fil_rev_8_21_14_0_10_42_9]